MNHVMLIGTLVRDPELIYAAKGTPIWKATIAVNGARWSSSEGEQVVTTDFISLQAFGWLAEELVDQDYIQGESFHVVGHLDQSSYETKNGKVESRTRVTVDTVTPTRRKQVAARDPDQRRQPEMPPPPDDSVPF